MIKKVFLIVSIILVLVFGVSTLQSNKSENEFVFWTIQLKGVADEIIEKNTEVHTGSTGVSGQTSFPR